ncbi:hypothetical protein ESZ47_02420 [Leuconostoc litchii]|uniref:Uncharacterized protein n=1 Tax=Leuconostoc litchii TaxID=1981069 RepID=A0A6P2CPH4_9LACO|nr:hypothetical protein ESZ47_02420 [Leuconostoc litchii]
MGDVNDEKSNRQYGQIFIFDSADERERENISQHFGLPVAKDNLEMLKYLKKSNISDLYVFLISFVAIVSNVALLFLDFLMIYVSFSQVL